MHLLVGQAPQRAQQRHQQQRPLGVDARRAAGMGGQRGRALLLGQVHRQPTQRQQVQALDQRQRIEMQGASDAPVISWRGNRCLVSVSGRYHGMPPGHGDKPRSRSILPLPPQLRNALRETSID
jgi:hypothetical protein